MEGPTGWSYELQRSSVHFLRRALSFLSSLTVYEIGKGNIISQRKKLSRDSLIPDYPANVSVRKLTFIRRCDIVHDRYGSVLLILLRELKFKCPWFGSFCSQAINVTYSCPFHGGFCSTKRTRYWNVFLDFHFHVFDARLNWRFNRWLQQEGGLKQNFRYSGSPLFNGDPGMQIYDGYGRR